MIEAKIIKDSINMQKGFTQNVLDNGFVRYIDHYGSDQRILESARISYKSPSKGDIQDKKLLGYLYKNHHCYTPEMEVLTKNGWKKWQDCQNEEEFAIPNPDSKNISFEKLQLLKFYVTDEDMCGFKNKRMSYLVTSNHKMWIQTKSNFRKKNYKFDLYEANNAPKWGHFENINNYQIKIGDTNINDYFKLLGFYLGDGFLRSKKIISFRLVLDRKIKYLTELLNSLQIPFELKNRGLTSAGNQIIQFYIKIADIQSIEKYIDVSKTASDKEFANLDSLSIKERAGLLDGLINSDGSISDSRPIISYSSNSKKLTDLVQNLASFLGYDCHYTKSFRKIYTVNLHKKCSKQHLEIRGEYLYKQKYTGYVYCTTSSTGLLIVRGAENEFAFICGNSSPFEQSSITFNIKLPLFVQAQLVRHRTARLNQVSARYTEMSDDFYIPSEWRKQDIKNKQGSLIDANWQPIISALGEEAEGQKDCSELFEQQCKEIYSVYKSMVDSGVAREMARMILPQNLYTEIYWNMDLNNLLKFFRLRDDSHAQYEIQEYAKVMKEMTRELFPWTMEAFDKYKWKLVENN